MWWEPRSETESRLIGEVNRLLELYRVHVGSTTGALAIRGIGAGPQVTSEPEELDRALTLAQEWHPLVLVDDRLAGRPRALARRFRLQDLDPSSVAAGVLADWRPSEDLLVEPVGPIVPAVRPGNRYQGAGPATVGLPVTAGPPGPQQGFLTVAHGVGNVGSPVTISASAGAAHGTVSYRDESALLPNGGDDIALVLLDPPHQLAGWVVNQGPQPVPTGPPYPASAVDLFGSVSGTVLGQVSGVMLQMGDLTWQWLDCWQLGVTQPNMKRGDSGALAVIPTALPSPYILGHFVGGDVAMRSNTGFANHWVQDLGRVLGRHPALTSMIAF
jgi:hypothetical protein